MSKFDALRISLNNNNLLPSFVESEDSGNITSKQIVVKTDVEKVVSIDEKPIELILKSDSKVSSTAGFLVEFFLSGSDGRITKILKDDLVDLYGDVLEDGFSKYLLVEFDK